jgi:hypothetical protein
MPKLYRCTNPDCAEHPAGFSIFDFIADEGKCPKCALTHTVGPRVITHLYVHDPERRPGSAPGPRGFYRIACGVPTARNHRTLHPEVVTCPLCIATKEWQETTAREQALHQGNVVPVGDFEIEVDFNKKGYKKPE